MQQLHSLNSAEKRLQVCILMLFISLLIYFFIDWLKDKLAANGMMLAAVYRPASMIPVEIWKASPTTTNGNEQSHRNIYHDGIKMSLVPGAMRSFQFDYRAMVTLEIFEEYGIHPRDRLPTYYLRAARAIVRTSE